MTISTDLASSDFIEIFKDPLLMRDSAFRGVSQSWSKKIEAEQVETFYEKTISKLVKFSTEYFIK